MTSHLTVRHLILTFFYNNTLAQYGDHSPGTVKLTDIFPTPCCTPI